MLLRTLIYFLLMVSLPICAQNLTLEGVLKDENQMLVAYANVVLQNSENDTFVSGTTSDETGRFTFEKLNSGNYVLKITYLGYEDFTESISLEKQINLGVLTLKEKKEELDGVLVVAKRPTIKRLVDRLVFNVENSTLSNNNVLDVLKRTPGVLVNNDKITVKNSDPIVYINDRRVYLSSSEVVQLLEGTTATNIKSIEVIDNPPAKYDAEGGAVINIVTSKNIISGYNGSVFGNYKQGYKFPKYSLGTSHFFKTKKLNTYFNLNISPREDYREIDEFIQFFSTDNQLASYWESNYLQDRKSSDQNINTNIEYDFDEHNKIGFVTNILVSPRDNTKGSINSSTEVFNSNGNLDSIFNTANKSVRELINLAFTADYVHKFKTEGEKISISVHHTDYDLSSFQDVNTGYFLPNTDSAFRDNKFQTFSSQKTKLFTAQTDYELPLKENSLFEAGLKISDINSESIINQFVFENGDKMEDLANSDSFIYDESLYAAYVSYSKDWQSWSLKLGLRTEYTNNAGYSNSTNQTNSNSYFKFFPSFYLLNKINDKNEMFFSYNKRIYRPNYNELNPFKFFINDNSYFTGNPNLKPQVDDTFTLGYTFSKNYTIEAYYRYEKDPAIQIVFQDNENNLIKYITTNIDKSISYGFDFTTVTALSKNWSLYSSSSIFYYENQFNALESNNQLFSNNKWTLLLQINNNINLLKDKSLAADISYIYISPFAQGPLIVGTRSGLDINFKKLLFKERASISIGVTDVFNTQNHDTSTKYLNQDIYKSRNEENRLFVLAFNYKFGNFRLNIPKKEIDLEERERLNYKNNI